MSARADVLHTPLPWTFNRRGLSPAIRDSEMRLIAEFPYHSSSRANFALEDEAIANVNLILQAVNGYATLRAERDALAVALTDLTEEVALNAYHPAIEHMGPLVIAARAALAAIKEPTK